MLAPPNATTKKKNGVLFFLFFWVENGILIGRHYSSIHLSEGRFFKAGRFRSAREQNQRLPARVDPTVLEIPTYLTKASKTVTSSPTSSSRSPPGEGRSETDSSLSQTHRIRSTPSLEFSQNHFPAILISSVLF